MATIDFFVKRLEKLQDLLAMKLDIVRRNGELAICGVQFAPIQKLNFYADELAEKGILVRHLSEEEARYCEANRISYFNGKDKLKVFKDAAVINIEPSRKLGFKKRHSSWDLGYLPSPTLIVSPNGFKILDALFAQPSDRLKDFRSGLAFAKQFQINQPKLSKIMRTLKVPTVFDLRKTIAALPAEWWRMALSDKSTFKRLTKFFQAATPHYSLLNLTPREISEHIFDGAIFDTIAPGPLDVARGYGYLRDEDISVWGTKEALHKLKAKYKLIPGVEKEKPVWHLATPKYGLQAEAIMSNMIINPNDSKPIFARKINVFRSIWDLGFGTERLREVQISILKEVMSEI